MATPFIIKKGLRKALPDVSSQTVGTIFFCTDTGELYIDYQDAEEQPQRRLVLQNELSQIDNNLNTLEENLDTVKMDKLNPTGTGSFSLGRRLGSTIGPNSVAMGNNVTASGNSSFAEGYSTKATSYYAHAEGCGTQAANQSAHSEGENTTASGYCQHVQGKYNISDQTFAHIVGNGTDTDSLSNAHTLDWDGNAWFAGDVYIGSTSGTKKDDGSKKLATEDYVISQIGSFLNSSS